MAARKTRKEFQDGMKKLGNMFDKMAEEHLGKCVTGGEVPFSWHGCSRCGDCMAAWRQYKEAWWQ
jgi:hypothetical protein